MRSAVPAAWLHKGYFDLSKQDPDKNLTHAIRRHLCGRLGLRNDELVLAHYPRESKWKHTLWWRESKSAYREAQFFAAISHRRMRSP